MLLPPRQQLWVAVAVMSAFLCTSSRAMTLDRQHYLESKRNVANARSGNQDIADKDLHRQLSKIGPKIIGGQPASIGQFPFFTQLSGYIDGVALPAICAASLIHSDILLSTAGCSSRLVNNATAIVGAYYQRSSKEGYLRALTPRRSIHPNYDSQNALNNYAVLKLDRPVPTSAVLLNSDPFKPFVADPLQYIGLGQTNSSTGPLASVLQQVVINYLEPEDCRYYYRNDVPGFVNSTVQFCAAGPDPFHYQGSCNGDAGGPVLSLDGYQVGVISNGVSCGKYGHPGISARVSVAFTWIQQQVCALSEYPPLYCPGAKVGNKTLVRIDVQYSEQPPSTMFSLRNSTPGLSLYTSGPTGGDKNKIYSKSLSLYPGYYYLNFSSSYLPRDRGGFVSAFAILNGRYNPLFSPTKAIFKKPLEYYEMPIPKADSPGKTTPSSKTQVIVETRFDLYPNETGWAIYHAGNGSFVTGLSSGPNSYSLKVYSKTVSLYPGSYTFQVFDTYGDGFCCAFGVGYYSVHAKVRGGYKALITPTYGTFNTTSKRTLITVPHN